MVIQYEIIFTEDIKQWKQQRKSSEALSLTTR